MRASLNYQKIVEIKKRMDFNQTEPETLIELIKDAMEKSTKVQESLTRLRKHSKKIFEKLESVGIFFTESTFNDIELPFKTAVGIDGSYQLVGGVGGQWYAPISTVRVVFPKYLEITPEIDVYWAGIEEIIEQEDMIPSIAASIMMLVCETKALNNWGTKEISSFIMIDGPIVDPPVISYGGKKYINDRCSAINNSIKNSILLGCVKRSRDKFYIDYLSNKYASLKKKIKNFPSDQHLFAHLFANIRTNGYYGPIYTRLIDISEINSLFKLYKKNGVNIGCFFYQNNIISQVLRIDVVINTSIIKKDDINHVISKALNLWTFSGHDYPAPIFVAHQKCNIREGCAEVLYEEILTRMHDTEIENQIVLTQLR